MADICENSKTVKAPFNKQILKLGNMQVISFKFCCFIIVI